MRELTKDQLRAVHAREIERLTESVKAAGERADHWQARAEVAEIRTPKPDDELNAAQELAFLFECRVHVADMTSEEFEAVRAVWLA
mgnify:CR=1 FL=1